MIAERGQTDEPVSYTHLDVYKRQLHVQLHRHANSIRDLVEHHVMRHPKVAAIESEIRFQLFVPVWQRREAVSYTHLDVYKRQLPGRANHC